MEKNLRLAMRFKWLILLLTIFEIPSVSTGQSLKISDFVLFAGNGNCKGCEVQLGSANNIKGGIIGSYTDIKTGGNFSINGSIISGGTILLSSNTVITGNISAANSQSIKGSVLSAGPKATINGNIDVNGNISFGASGKVTGTVTQPAGSIYQGPVPSGGNVTGVPNLPALPAMPAITDFPNAGTQNINSTQTITPGAYGNLTLS
ncbi:MAG: polymer-forming cytoskeletal protein, partial [Ginsengibacter sp.]